MIQGAINQLIGIAAAAKKAYDVSSSRAEKAAIKLEREETAKYVAMQRAKQKIQAKNEQKKQYKEFLSIIGPDNQAPDELKRIAYEEYLRQRKSTGRK